MNNKGKYDSILGQPHVANLLLLILDRTEIIASELRIVSKNYAKIAQIAKLMEDKGLIEIEIESSPRVTHIYRLTLKGLKIAEKLREIEGLLND